jgi:hydrogenase maturation protein HypF
MFKIRSPDGRGSSRDQQAAVRIAVEGVVQGVGFRPFVVQRARALGLTGRVWNGPDGAVVEAFGSGASLRALARSLCRCALPGAALARIVEEPIDWQRVEGFAVVASAPGPGAGIPLAPDLSMCPACLEEIRDPASRRYRYPFTACAHCGPRFSAVLALPYDRERTTLAGFSLCASCRAEYEDPADRRFHAEAIACPRCGPRLTACAATGAPLAHEDAALGAASSVIRDGGIVALLGVGGVHLTCDATNEAAVSLLRVRKRRERRPLAVMVADLPEAEKLAILDSAERALLMSVARPIVLARVRDDAALAPSLAPGLDRIGLLLPYTPLHQLLLDDLERPLVMTSGNRSGEPMAFHVEDVLERLADVADLFLLHDRPIPAPCDDSVAIVGGETVIWIRRARGIAPRSVELTQPVAQPTLGCGAHLHAAVCLAVDDQAFLSPHLGDLDSAEALDAFENAIARLEAFTGTRAELLAHDLHPGYAGTRWARARRDRTAVGVQHHHAHLAAVLADAGFVGPAFGLLWDGTGWGPDGCAWGGELLLGDAGASERLATFRPLRLAGGEAAIREPWRLALAAVDDAFDGEAPLEALSLFANLDVGQRTAVRRLLRSDAGSVAAHGVGRWFDAIGALVLESPIAGYAGEIALAWNAAARGRYGTPYPFAVDRTLLPWQIDLRPMVRAVVADLVSAKSAGEIAARFHETLAAAAEALLRAVAPEHGSRPVALSGGCFQNALLVERVAARVAALGLDVIRHRDVPPGDGGIALGQVVAADAVVRARS